MKVLIHGRINITLMKLRVTFNDDKSFLISDFSEVEYMGFFEDTSIFPDSQISVKISFYDKYLK